MNLLHLDDLFLNEEIIETHKNDQVSKISVDECQKNDVFDDYYKESDNVSEHENLATPMPQTMLNLFNLKVYAILMCRGDTRLKAEYLYDLIMLHNRKKNHLNWSNLRLRDALKMLVYFSEVLPKKYINEVHHFKGIQIQYTPRGLLSSRTQDIVSEQGEEWEMQNVKILESSFDDIIEQVYEKLFIDRIWGKNMFS